MYNVSLKASEENLRAFFGYCGKIKEGTGLKQQYDKAKNEFCWTVEFERAESARTACMLHGTALLGNEIKILSKCMFIANYSVPHFFNFILFAKL